MTDSGKRPPTRTLHFGTFRPTGTSAIPGHPVGRQTFRLPPRRRQACLWLLLLFVTLASAPDGWLPMLANTVLRACLKAQDLAYVQFRVDRLTPWNLQAAVSSGRERMRSQIDCIDVHFSPSGLFHRRLDRIEVHGGMIQMRVSTNGLTVCGLPDRLPSFNTGLEDADAPPAAPWQVDAMLVDNVYLRVRPPGDSDRALYLWMQASAVTDDGELRFVAADHADSGLQANGAIALASGNGWLVASLPENDLRDWVRLAQWQRGNREEDVSRQGVALPPCTNGPARAGAPPRGVISEPRGRRADFCKGAGSATLTARMAAWKPTLVQGDVSLRATLRLPDASVSGDLRLHGLAEWEPDSTRPRIRADFDLGVRSATAAGVFWSGDNGLPATLSAAVVLEPQKDSWECQVQGRASVAQDAVAACLPVQAGLATGAVRINFDGLLTTPDLRLWDGQMHARAVAPKPQASGPGWRVSAGDAVVDGTLNLTSSVPAEEHGMLVVSGIQAAGKSANCGGVLEAVFRAQAPFTNVQLAVTVVDTGARDQTPAKSGLAPQVRERLQRALQDLTFGPWRLNLAPQADGGGTLHVQLEGRTGAGKTVPPVAIDASVKGPLEALFNFGLEAVGKTE